MRKIAIAMFVGVFGLASYPISSFAAGTAEQRAACTPDVFRLCSSEIPFVSKIVACLEHKRSQLSPKCRANFHPSKTMEASAHSRSLGAQPAISLARWCNFHEAARDKQQQQWLEWCGTAAHE